MAVPNLFQFLGVITYILGVCNELVAPASRKAKKRASQSPDELKTSEALTQLNLAVQETITALEDAFLAWPTYNVESTLEDAMRALSLDRQNYVCPVESRLNSTRNELISDVTSTLKKKVKYLKSLVQP